MHIRVAKKTAISGTGDSKIPWQWAKESWRDVKKIFVFWFCSSPDPAIVKPISRIFGNFITQHFLWIIFFSSISYLSELINIFISLNFILITSITFTVLFHTTVKWDSFLYCVPHIVFRFLIFLLNEDRAIICLKPYLPAFWIRKQCELHLRSRLHSNNGGSRTPNRFRMRDEDCFSPSVEVSEHFKKTKKYKSSFFSDSATKPFTPNHLDLVAFKKKLFF